MRYLKISCILLLVAGISDVANPDEAPGNVRASKTSSAHTTRIISLQNVPAQATAEAISDVMAARRRLAMVGPGAGSVPACIIKADARINVLIVQASESDFAEIVALAKVADKPVDEIVIPAKISIVSLDGKEQVLSRPTIRTINGVQAVIEIGMEDGTNLKFEVTPRVVRGKE